MHRDIGLPYLGELGAQGYWSAIFRRARCQGYWSAIFGELGAQGYWSAIFRRARCTGILVCHI